MLLRTILFISLSVFYGTNLFGQTIQDTNRLYFNRLHFSLGSEVISVANTLSSYETFAGNSTLLQEIDSENVMSGQDTLINSLDITLGYERVFELRRNKRWFSQLGVFGEIRFRTFDKSLKASRASYSVLDTLTGSAQGTQYILGSGSAASYQATYLNKKLGLDIGVRSYFFRDLGMRFLLFGGVGFSHHFNRNSSLSVDRTLTTYTTLDETYYQGEISNDEEYDEYRENGASSLAFTLGFTTSLPFELCYTYRRYISGRAMVGSNYFSHQFTLVITPAFGKYRDIYFERKANSRSIL